MMPGLAMDAADWNEYAQGLTRAALQAKQAAQAQDADALFDAGGAIYNVCRACHNQYMAQDDFQCPLPIACDACDGVLSAAALVLLLPCYRRV